LLLLNNDDVAKVLDMPLCLAALDGVFQEMAIGDSVGMGRIDVYVPSGETQAPYYRWAVMTGGSRKDGYVCARMLSDMVSWPREYGRIRENKWAREPGTFCGLLFLFSAKDATPVAMIKDGFLQHYRVGGGAGLGVKYLSRPDGHTVGMIGSGGTRMAPGILWLTAGYTSELVTSSGIAWPASNFAFAAAGSIRGAIIIGVVRAAIRAAAREALRTLAAPA